MHIVSLDVFRFRKQLAELSRVRNIAFCGLFAAAYIILSRFNIRISDILEIRLGFLVLAAAGMYGGPVMGLTVGVISDIISTILNGQAFFPGFTISYGSLAFLFGVIFYHSRPTVPRCIVASMVDAAFSLFLNTYWLALMYYGADQYLPLLITRLPKCAVMLVVDAILLVIAMGAFRRVFRTVSLWDPEADR